MFYTRKDISAIIMINKKKRYKSKEIKIINLLIGILCGVIAVGCLSVGIYFYSLSYDSGEFDRLLKAADSRGGTVSSVPFGNLPSAAADMEEERVIDLSELQQENKDLVGWINIPGTEIDYPVMHTPKDGDYYLRRNFSGKNSLSGVPFIDETCSIDPRSDNIIIYGHNMKNGSMFSDLLSYEDKKFWEEHKEIFFHTFEGMQEYEILAAFPINALAGSKPEQYYSVSFLNEEEFGNYINKIQKESLYSTGIGADYGDELLTLSTCSYHVEDGRFLVISRKK